MKLHEIYKETPCIANFISNWQKKKSCFSFYLSSIFFYKIEDGGERGRRMNTVQKCIYIYINAKMIPVETVLGISGEGIKESGGQGEFKYDIFDTS
jgi:hypothetical protein